MPEFEPWIYQYVCNVKKSRSHGVPIGVNSSAQEKGMLPQVLARKFLKKTARGNTY